MATLCIAGAAPGIGKTAVAELLLGHLSGWHAARVRIADEVSAADAATLGDLGYRIVAGGRAVAADAELARLASAGAVSVLGLLTEPRGLAPGLKALAARVPAGANLVVEGNAFLWGGSADVAVMVIGAGPSGRGLVRVRPSVKEICSKVDIWTWNTRGDACAEGFFEFPQALAGMGFRDAISSRCDFHHINPRVAAYQGNAPFVQCVRDTIERRAVRRDSQEFLRKAGFDV